MKVRCLVGALTLCAVLVNCGGDDKDDVASEMISAFADLPPCSEWLSRTVTSDEVEDGCTNEETLFGTGVHNCKDGRQLYWNDIGWGYVGQPMTAHSAGAEKVAPAGERTGCGI